jgi:uncharacterized membrane protein
MPFPVFPQAMPRASHAIDIAAPPPIVWKHLTDVAGFPDWAYGVKRVEFVTRARSGVGVQWKQVEALGPAPIVHLMEITREDAPREFAIESMTKPHVGLSVRLEARPGERTHLAWDLEYEMPAALAPGRSEPLIGDWYGRTLLRRLAEGLKAHVERREARREKTVPAPGAPEVGGTPGGLPRDPEVVAETAKLETTGEKLGPLPPVEPGKGGRDEPPVAP